MLDQDERAVLFGAFLNVDDPKLDIEHFRIKHKKRLPVIEHLIERNLLVADGELYRVTLDGLHALNNEASRAVIDTFNAVLPVLESMYELEGARKTWTLSELADYALRSHRLTVNERNVGRALWHLLPSLRISNGWTRTALGEIGSFNLAEPVLNHPALPLVLEESKANLPEPDAPDESEGQDGRDLSLALRRQGWVLPTQGTPFARGGGAKVYRCYNLALIERTVELGAADNVAIIGGPVRQAEAERREEAACVAVDGLFHRFVENDGVAVVKVPHRTDDRTRREVQAMQRCVHPHLTRILAVDEAPTPAWFVMEYHPKGTLEDRRDEFRGRPLEVLRRIRPVVEALAIVHEANLVHRDVKPRNILVSREDKWVLSDFGIVFSADEERLTETAHPVWSRDWRPDWVARRAADRYTASVDVFMVARVIYALVLGENPPASQIRAQPDCDLRRVFPNVEGIDLLQTFVERHVTLREEECASHNATELLARIDELIRAMEGSTAETLLFNWLATDTGNTLSANADGRLGSLIYLGRRYRRICGRARLFRNGGSSTPQGFSVKDVVGGGPAMESTKQGITGEVPRPLGAWTDEMLLTLPQDFRPGWYELDVPAHSTATLTGFVLVGMDGTPAPPPTSSDSPKVAGPERRAITRLDQIPQLELGAGPLPSSPLTHPDLEVSLTYTEKSVTEQLHQYELVASIRNDGRKRLDDWELEIELPTPLLEPGITVGIRVPERSDAVRTLFRAGSHNQAKALRVGDRQEVRIAYRMDQTLYARKDELFPQVVSVRAFVNGELSADIRRTVEQMQAF
jgi:serine/threonine protein kinase